MAHLLTISYGTVTVNLNSGNIRMMEQYVPRMGDGETTVDGVQLEFSGTAAADINASIASITKAMTQAVRYNSEGVGDRVFLKFQPDGYASAYSSELVPESSRDWSLTLDNDSMGTARWGGVSSVRNYQVQGYLNWKRRDYWQASAVQLKISNDNGTDNTAGLNVYNCNDAAGTAPTKRNNYFDVSGTSILGADLPCPVKIEFRNTSPGTIGVGSMWISCNTFGTAIDYWDYDYSAASDSASNNYYTSISLSATYTRTPDTKSADLYPIYGNQPLGLLTRFHNKPPANTYGYIELAYPESVGEPFILKTDTKLQLTTIIPRVYESFTGLDFYAKGDSGGTLCLDYVLPICMNNYIVGLVNYPIPYNGSDYYLLYDAELKNAPQFGVYVDPATPITFSASRGSGVYLDPGKNQRLMVLWDDVTGDCDITKYFSVKLYYYPRRRTL